MHPDLFSYQREGAFFLADHWSPNAILADALGLGKSNQSITAADLIGAKSVLILCPGIARSGWVREWKQWSTRNLTIKALYSSKDIPDTDVVVCSYSLLPSQKARMRLMQRHWSLIIADEGHKISNRNNKTTRAIYGNRCNGEAGLKSKADRFWLLSGTLISNHLGEAWTHCRALFPDAVKGLERYSAWQDHFLTTRETEYGTAVTGSRNMADFVQRIKPFALRRTAEQVLKDLPAMRVDTVLLDVQDLPPRSEEIAEVERVLGAAMAMSDKGNREEAKALMAGLKEFHIASLRRWVGISKAPAVAAHIKNDFDNNGLDRMVLFFVHTEVAKILHAGIPGSAVIDGRTSSEQRDAIIDSFQGRPGVGPMFDNPPRCLIIQLSIGSTALTLTAACHVGVAESNWAPKDVIQAFGRVRRIGQKRPVQAKIYTLLNSLDEQINATLARKTRDIAAVEAGLAAA